MYHYDSIKAAFNISMLPGLQTLRSFIEVHMLTAFQRSTVMWCLTVSIHEGGRQVVKNREKWCRMWYTSTVNYKALAIYDNTSSDL